MGHHQCTHILFDDICWRRSVQLIGQFLDSVADHRIDMGLRRGATPQPTPGTQHLAAKGRP
jgi:hypothetical protein